MSDDRPFTGARRLRELAASRRAYAGVPPTRGGVWSAPTTDARLKKRMVRTIIHEVVADIDDDAAEIVLAIHWVGGVHTELRLPRPRQRNCTSADIIDAVRQLVLIVDDDLIAGAYGRPRHRGECEPSVAHLASGGDRGPDLASCRPGLDRERDTDLPRGPAPHSTAESNASP